MPLLPLPRLPLLHLRTRRSLEMRDLVWTIINAPTAIRLTLLSGATVKSRAKSSISAILVVFATRSTSTALIATRFTMTLRRTVTNGPNALNATTGPTNLASLPPTSILERLEPTNVSVAWVNRPNLSKEGKKENGEETRMEEITKRRETRKNKKPSRVWWLFLKL